jgi:3-hydroxybutyryl-CoA dehydrogenase
VPDPRRVVGLHFFNPPVMMKLIEVVAGIQTSDETISRAQEFAASIGKETVVCRKDRPGFITTRAYVALRLECLRILEEGVATAEDIDKALRLAFGFPMGPLELGDFNGLDTNLKVMDGLCAAYGDRFRPPPLLRTMVASNLLGRKSGAGFYRYDADVDGAASDG